MKTVLVVFSFLGVALTAAAYQAGPQNRTNLAVRKLPKRGKASTARLAITTTAVGGKACKRKPCKRKWRVRRL